MIRVSGTVFYWAGFEDLDMYAVVMYLEIQ